MATLTVNGVKVTVDDSFRDLSPEQQEATVNEIASSLNAQPAPEAPADGGGITGALQSFGTGAADLASFGFADELGAGARYLGGKILPWQSNVTYDQALEEVRAQNQAVAEANPGSYLAGQVTGGLGAATGLGRLGVSAPGIFGAPATNVGRVLQGAGEGAAYGGLYGVGSGEGGGDRAVEGLKGAAIGGVAGAALPVVSQGVSGAYRSIADSLARNKAARQAGVSPEVAAYLSRSINADDALGARGAANMARSGREAMLVNSGQATQGALDAAIQQRGPGSNLASRRIAERVSRDADAVTAALDQTLGTPEGVGAAQANIRSGARRAIADAYDGPNGAYAQAIDYASSEGRRVEDIISRIPPRIAGKAVRSANERMIYDQMPNQQILADIADDGTVAFREMPNVRQADAIKRALNDIVEEGTDDFGKMTPDAQFASRMAKDLRDAVRDAVPEYKTALETAADPLSRQSAVELGGKLLSQGMTRDRLKAAASRFTTAPEKDAIAQGVRSNIDDIMANVRRTIQNGDTDAREAYKAISEISSRANREKLASVLGEERVRPLFDELDRAAESFQLQGRLADQTLTASRTETINAVKAMNAPGAIKEAMGGAPIQAGQKVARFLTGQTPEATQALNDQAFLEIADILTRPTSQAIPDFQAMTNFGNQTLANQVRANRIAELLMQGQAGVYPASAQVGDRFR